MPIASGVGHSSAVKLAQAASQNSGNALEGRGKCVPSNKVARCLRGAFLHAVGRVALAAEKVLVNEGDRRLADKEKPISLAYRTVKPIVQRSFQLHSHIATEEEKCLLASKLSHSAMAEFSTTNNSSYLRAINRKHHLMEAQRLETARASAAAPTEHTSPVASGAQSDSHVA